MELKRLTSPDQDLLGLIQELDKELAITDGDEHAFYNQYNGLENINHFVIIQKEEAYIACGAFKEFSTTDVEIKRMYVKPEARGNKLAVKVLEALELWAKELAYENAVLETGKRQLAAIQLYKNCGYKLRPNYGQYIGMNNSLCFTKSL